MATVIDGGDADGDPYTTSITWTLDDLPQPDLDGVLSLPPGSLLRDQAWTVTVVHDDGLSTSPAGFRGIVVDNAAPVLADVTMTALDVDRTTFTCNADWDDPEGGVTLRTLWYLDDRLTDTDDVFVLPLPVAAGTELRCQVRATDDRGATDAGEATTIVGDDPPVIESVTITTDGDGVMFDTFDCNVSAFDPEDGAPTITRSWFTRDPSDPAREREFGTESSDTIDLTDFVAPGTTFYCRATATDSAGNAVSATAEYTLGNLPPFVVTEAAITPAPTLRTGQEARCTFGADDDDHFDLTYAYSWRVGETEVGTGPTHTPDGVSVVRGDTLTCVATATDPLGAVIASSASVDIINSPPIVRSIAIAEPFYDVSPFATCDADIWDPDGDDITVEWSWAWYPGGAPGALPWDTQVVSGPFNGGTRFSCAARPSDPFSTGNLVVSPRLLAEENVAPMISVITLEPAEPGTRDTILATWEVDDPNAAQTVTVDVRWLVNGATVATSGTSLASTFFDVDDMVTLELTPDDGYVTGDTASASVTIGNSLPTISTVELAPFPAVRGRDSLRCAVGTVTDADGDSVTVSIAWDWRRSINFSTYATPLTSTLDGDTIPADAPAGLYRCTVTAEDERSGARQAAVESPLVGNPFTLRGPGDGYGEQVLVGNHDYDVFSDLLLPSPYNETRQAQLVLGEQVLQYQNAGFTGRAFTGVAGFDIFDELAFEYADVDGDGLDDIIVVATAPWDEDGEDPYSGGGVFVFPATMFPSDGTMMTPDMAPIRLTPPVAHEVLAGVWSLGDLDFDGTVDLVVIAREADGRVNPLTQVFILTRDSFLGDALADATWVIAPSIESDVLRVADIDGDTVRDLVFDQGGATWVLPTSALPAPGPITFRGPGHAIITELPEGTTAQIAGDFDGDGIDDVLLHTPLAELNQDRVAVISGRSFQAGGDGYDGARIALLPPTGTYQPDATWAPVVTGIGDLDDDGSDDVFVRYHRAYELYEGLSDTNYSLGCIVYGGAFVDTPASTCVAYGGVDVRSGGTATVAEIDGDGIPDLFAINAFYTSSTSTTVNGSLYGYIQPEGFAVCTPSEIPSVVDMIEDKAVAYDILPCVCGAGESCWRDCEDFLAAEYTLTPTCTEAARQLLECAVDEECNTDCRGTDPDACRACIVDECRAWAFITGYDGAVR